MSRTRSGTDDTTESGMDSGPNGGAADGPYGVTENDDSGGHVRGDAAAAEAVRGFIPLLDYPLYVVTVASAGERAGCLVGFASQCSIGPERFMIWLSRANHTFGVARSAALLGVHLLGRDQYALAELFGGRTGDRFDKFGHVRWYEGEGGTPVLTDAPAWFVGRVEGRTDGGDHVGFLLTPVTGGGPRAGRGDPLRLSDAAGLTAGHPAT